MTRERLASIANKLVNARLALCLASDDVLSLPIHVTMVALRSNTFCQTNRELRKQTFSCSSIVFGVQLSELCVQLSDSGVQLSVAYGCCATK